MRGYGGALVRFGAALSFLLAPSTVYAQVCRGTGPFGQTGGADYGFEAALAFPERGRSVFGEFRVSPVTNLAFSLNTEFATDVDRRLDREVDVWLVGGDVTHRFQAAPERGLAVDACLMSGFHFYKKSDLPVGEDETGLVVPIGVAIGKDVPLGSPRLRLAPYVRPTFAFQRRYRRPQADETDALFFVELGASLIFPRAWYLGLDVAIGDAARVPAGDMQVRVRGGWLVQP